MIIDELIFDRSTADIETAQGILGHDWDSLTEAQKAAYLAYTLKGLYKHTDINRVGNAQIYLKSIFDTLPAELREYLDEAIDTVLGSLSFPQSYYTIPTPVLPDALAQVPYSYPVALQTVKTDWTTTDIPAETTNGDAKDITYYLANITTLLGLIPLPAPPTPPTTLDGLTIEGANEIERALSYLYTRHTEYKAERETDIDTAKKNAIDGYNRVVAEWWTAGEITAGGV